MVNVCVICMVRRPPLSPLEAQHRALLEAMVSPAINTDELKACQWLLCANCKLLMQTVYNFQQTALIGVKNLRYLLHNLNTERTIVEDTKPMICIKIEPGHDATPAPKKELTTDEAPANTNTLTEELDVKFEPEPDSEHESEAEPEREAETASCMSSLNAPRAEQPATSIAASYTQPLQVIRKMPATAESQWKFEVFTHKPPPSQKPADLSSIRWKDGVREASQKRKKYKPPRVTCPHCGMSIRDNGSLKMHIIRLHSEVAPCKCDVCGKECRNQMVLKYHKYCHREKQHKEQKAELFCKQCCIQFPSPSLYKIHLTTLRHLPRDQYTFECETCKMKFLDDKRRQEHVDIVHLGQRKHKCDRCDKTFGKPASLRKHIVRVHETRAPKAPSKHVCHLCGKTFSARKSLEEHLLFHEGLRPHQCPLCPANFTYSAALFTHNRLKHLKIKGKWKKKKRAEKGKKKEEGEERTEEVGTEVERTGEKGELLNSTL